MLRSARAWVITIIGIILVAWLSGAVERIAEHFGTYDVPTWVSAGKSVAAILAAIPPVIVGLVLGVALGICITGAIYEKMDRRARRRLENEKAERDRADEEERRRIGERNQQIQTMQAIGLLCAKASAAMIDAALSPSQRPKAAPKIKVATEKLRELDIELDSIFENIPVARYKSLQETFYEISQFLSGGSLRLAREAAEKHNAIAKREGVL